MRLKVILGSSALLVAMIFAGGFSARASEDAGVIANYDTHGDNAVILDLVRNGQSFARVLIREGNMGAVSMGPGKTAVGIVPEEISLRGDSVRLALYRLDRYQDLDSEGGRWIEDLELTRGEVVALPDRIAEAVGNDSFGIRLDSARLADR